MNWSQCADLGLSESPDLPSHSSTSGVYIAAGCIFILLSAFSVIANIIIIIAIVRFNFREQSSPGTNVSQVKALMTSMAVSDALIGGFSMPLGVYELFMNGHWALGSSLCTIKQAIDFFMCTVSVYHVICMAVDRYLAVCKPFVYITLSRRTSFYMIAVSWAIPAAQSLITFLGDWSEASVEDIVMCLDISEYCMVVFSLPHQIISVMISFYIPITVIYILYFLVAREIWKIQKRATKLCEGRKLKEGDFNIFPTKELCCYSKKTNNQLKKSQKQEHSLDRRTSDAHSIYNTCVKHACSQDPYCPVNNSTTKPDLAWRMLTRFKPNQHHTHLTKESDELSTKGYNFALQKDTWNHKECFDRPTQKPGREITNFCQEESVADLRSSLNHETVTTVTTGFNGSQLISNSYVDSEAASETINTDGPKSDHTSDSPDIVGKTSKGPRAFKNRAHAGFGSKKAVKTIGRIVICFTLCWLPFSIYMVFVSYHNYALTMWPNLVVTWLGYLNSALNPVLYCCNRSIREALRSFLWPPTLEVNESPLSCCRRSGTGFSGELVARSGTG